MYMFKRSQSIGIKVYGDCGLKMLVLLHSVRKTACARKQIKYSKRFDLIAHLTFLLMSILLKISLPFIVGLNKSNSLSEP